MILMLITKLHYHVNNQSPRFSSVFKLFDNTVIVLKYISFTAGIL